MITHPLIYCDWLEEQGKNVTLLRDDLECYSNDNHVGAVLNGFGFGSGSGNGYGDGNGDGRGWSFIQGARGRGFCYGNDEGGGVGFGYSIYVND